MKETRGLGHVILSEVCEERVHMEVWEDETHERRRCKRTLQSEGEASGCGGPDVSFAVVRICQRLCGGSLRAPEFSSSPIGTKND